MRVFQQLWLLLWKNYVLQKRKVLVTFVEIALPTFFALILIFVRQRVKAIPMNNATTWESFPASHHLRICPQPFCFGDYWKIYYTPQNNLTDSVMQDALRMMGPATTSHIEDVIGFPDEESLVKEFMEKIENASRSSIFSQCDILGGIIFTNMSESDVSFHRTIEYKIRLPYTPRTSDGSFHFDPNDDDTNWRTELMFPLYQKVGPRANKTRFASDPGYAQEGFLLLQNHIDAAIIRGLDPDTERSTPDLWRFPYPPYNQDMFILVLQNQFPFIIMLSFVFSALHIVKNIVHEKEHKLKESMKMMGLSSWLHWTAWFIKYLLFLLVSVSIMTVLFTVSTGENGSIVGYTSWSVLLVFLLLYAIATINFCFAVSVFFSKANSGAAAGGIIFFISYVPYAFLQRRYNTLTLFTKVSTCLFSNVAMSYGAQIIGMFEGTSAGVQWSTLGQGSSVDDSFTMLWVFIMLIFDAVLYVLIACYVETVWPGEYGVPQPWYFPILRTYWCGSVKQGDLDLERTPLLSHDIGSQSEFIESEPTTLKSGISIKKLRKVFKTNGKEKVAVEGMSMKMYEGQITALLGHNGAGKTTTMSMLTGFFPPTSGSALVNGHDIRTDIAGVRQSLGLCPQHNVLFDTLTVSEHLEFFAKLKGCPSTEVPAEIDSILETLGLGPKRDALTRTLSGGMKRKLSVGIALIGGSKIVILDEPTSGMDPDARRHTWDILQRHRAGRTMVLTTHFMDEADVLGDRIAIMADGVIQCCGTPLFLKNKYGAGYHMVMVKEQGCDTDTVTSVVQKHVPDARMESDVSLELSFILPHESKAQFVALFDEIENRRSELKIASYGASVTTMEEVFLKVGESHSDEERRPSSSAGSYSSLQRLVNGAGVYQISTRNRGQALYRQQLRAMFLKRVIHTGRNWLVTLTQLLVPLFFTILSLIVLKTLPRPEDSPPLSLDMSNFFSNYIPYAVDDHSVDILKNLSETYAGQFRGYDVSPVAVDLDPGETMDEYLVGIGARSIAKYNSEYLLAMELGMNNKSVKATAFFNAQSFHTAPITLNAIDNMWLKYSTNESYTLKTINHPFPRSVANKINDQMTRGFEGFMIAVNLVFGMSFLASSFVLFLVKERTMKVKHCEFVSGVQSWTFWLATFFWDMINYLMPCLLLILTFAAFGIDAYTEDGHFLDILLLFVLYGWAVLPFMYLLSLLFTVPASGFVWLSMFNIFSGIATVLTVNILRIPGLNTEYIAKTLDWVFLAVLPNFCLGQGLTDFYNNNQYLSICDNPMVHAVCLMNQTNPCCKDNCGDMCLDYTENYLSWQPGGIGRHLVFMFLQGIFYFGILFLIESQAFQRLWYYCRPLVETSYVTVLDDDQSIGNSGMVQEDSDVAAERQRIVGADFDTLLRSETLILRELSKSYGNQMAVDKLSLGIQPGECFGLLGINGAGKTSTFKMLTGDEIVSGGDAFLQGFSIRTDIQEVRKQVGYCPQFDALIDELTGRETLTMYARLRGVPESDLSHSVDNMLQCLLLEQYADRLVKTYSGGNKRKLSTAIALIGDPPIVFLDEPSTGMDPVARRSLWDTLSDIRAHGRTLILTSHSMEECEALCTRLAIMVNGEIKCLGSPQHLKNKFGEGFTIMAKVGPSAGEMREPDTRPLIEHIVEQFPGSVVKDVHQGMVHIHVSDPTIKWALLFSTMEKCKVSYNVQDYSVSQTSLEQVFLNFARSQIAPQDPESGRCKQCCALWRMCGCCMCCSRPLIAQPEQTSYISI